jgi:uncharacterized protein (PEP-CTERM system associated)
LSKRPRLVVQALRRQPCRSGLQALGVSVRRSSIDTMAGGMSCRIPARFRRISGERLVLKRSLVWGLLIFAAASALVPECRAQGWSVTPHASIYQSYTSNASLNPSGQENSDFFTTVSPSVEIRGDTPRIKLSLDYSLEGIAYLQNSDLDQIRNNLNFVSTVILVPELLFVDGAASIAQVPTNGQSPVSSSPLASGTNLQTAYVYNLSPYVKHHFGTFADGELRYTFNQIFASNESGGSSGGSVAGSSQLSNSTTNRVSLTAVSGTQFTQFLWVVVADGADTSFAGDNPDTSSRLLEGSAEYRLDREFGLLASVGFEKTSDSTFFPESEPDGPIGSIGIKYTPSERTSLIVNLNHRYNLNFFTGSGTYQIGPQTELRSNYTDQVFTSSQSQFFNDVSFMTTDEFGNFIDSRTEQLFSLSKGTFGVENNAFRERNFDVGVYAVRGRNTFDLGGFWQKRNVYSTGEEDRAFGGAVSWKRALSRVTDFSLTARYANQEFDTGLNDEHQQLFGVGGSLVYHMNETLDGVIAANITRQLSDLQTDEFTEAVISLGLRKQF